MRPAGKGALESLYFHYPTFAARRVAELDGQRDRHPVAIAGAGPIGMTAALVLAQYDIRSVLLDRKDTFNDGSRAVCVARPSMQILQRIGAVEPFLAKALAWRYGRSFYRGHQIHRLEMPHPPNEKYLPMYNLQQQYIEQYLWDAIARSPLIDARWQSEVAAVEARADGVTLQIKSPPGDYALEAGYVLAADGARSAVRALRGLRLRGENHEGRYVIADVRMDHDFPTERRALFDPASNPGGTVLVHKQPDNIWRVDYQLAEGESEAEAVLEPTIRRRVQAILDDIGHTGAWELEWWSIYTANTLCLDDYRDGRVIFIGDSAHIVPIFGVRGLNNGLADACNIGWKLAYVLNGEAGEALLESYTPERRGATLDVFANATRSTRFMTPPTRGWALAREAVLSLAISHDYARKFADPRQMAPFSYSDSPLTLFADRDSEFASGPRRGSAAPDVKLSDGTFLLDQIGTGFAVLLFVDGPVDDEATRLLASVKRLDRRATVLRIALRGSGAPDADLHDDDGAIAEVFGAGRGTLYLLRPDLHIAGRWKTLQAEEVERSLRACLGGGKSS